MFWSLTLRYLYSSEHVIYQLFPARLNIVYPMLFKLTNERKGRGTHAGVLEFVADEGKAYIPHWVRFRQCCYS